MIHIKWTAIMHCADCARQLRNFVEGHTLTANVILTIPKGMEDEVDFEGYIEFDMDEDLHEESFKKEAQEEGFKVL